MGNSLAYFLLGLSKSKLVVDDSGIYRFFWGPGYHSMDHPSGFPFSHCRGLAETSLPGSKNPVFFFFLKLGGGEEVRILLSLKF